MRSENETVADIVKEKRYIADEAELKVKYTFAFDLANMLREEANRIEAAHQREVAELRECLKEAIREKCPFTRMSCKHGEPCDYECGTFKWRKALRKEGGAK